MGKQEIRQPVWSEGMFLTPHHMQYQQGHSEFMRWAMTRHIPTHPWGFLNLKLDAEALGQNRLAILEAGLMMPGGVYLEYPGNLELPSRDFKEFISGKESRVPVSLGLPEAGGGQGDLARDGASAPQARYQLDSLTAMDQNNGQNPAEIEVKHYRGRLFFGPEDTAGFQTIPLARLVRNPGGEGAALDARYIPPVLSLTAWEPLRLLSQELASRTAAAKGALLQNLAGRETAEILDMPRGLESAVKVQALAGSSQVLAQMAAAGQVHPFPFYLELVRLYDSLGLFAGAEAPEDAPLYRHNELGEVFLALKEGLGRLLDRLAAAAYQQRSFVRRHDRLEVDLDPDWVGGRRQLFLAVTGDDDPETMQKKLAGVKMCAPRDLEIVVQRRVGAIPVNWLRLAPSTLPAKSDGVYGQVTVGGAMWPGVEEDRVLVANGAEALPYRFDLFVV